MTFEGPSVPSRIQSLTSFANPDEAKPEEIGFGEILFNGPLSTGQKLASASAV